MMMHFKGFNSRKINTNFVPCQFNHKQMNKRKQLILGTKSIASYTLLNTPTVPFLLPLLVTFVTDTPVVPTIT